MINDLYNIYINGQMTPITNMNSKFWLFENYIKYRFPWNPNSDQYVNVHLNINIGYLNQSPNYYNIGDNSFGAQKGAIPTITWNLPFYYNTMYAGYFSDLRIYNGIYGALPSDVQVSTLVITPSSNINNNLISSIPFTNDYYATNYYMPPTRYHPTMTQADMAKLAIDYAIAMPLIFSSINLASYFANIVPVSVTNDGHYNFNRSRNGYLQYNLHIYQYSNYSLFLSFNLKI
jgi:hypothetical protein